MEENRMPKSLRILQRLLDEDENKVSKEDFMPTGIKKRRLFYCDDALWEEIGKKACSEGLSRSSILRKLAKLGLDLQANQSPFKAILSPLRA